MIFTVAGLHTLSAQEVLVQWTGVVRNDLLQPIPFAYIYLQKDHRSTMTNQQGMFTITTYPLDTLFVSSLGHKPVKIPIENI